jgi:H+-translocating NAD(P) transhydrogenase subunit alpha
MCEPCRAEPSRRRVLSGAGALVIAAMDPHGNEKAVAAMANANVTAFAMEFMPRITRAQRMDALSSQSTAAGYHAALLGAASLPRFFPMLMTAAGTVAPARVLVLGAGSIGLLTVRSLRLTGWEGTIAVSAPPSTAW